MHPFKYSQAQARDHDGKVALEDILRLHLGASTELLAKHVASMDAGVNCVRDQ